MAAADIAFACPGVLLILAYGVALCRKADSKHSLMFDMLGKSGFSESPDETQRVQRPVTPDPANIPEAAFSPKRENS